MRQALFYEADPGLQVFPIFHQWWLVVPFLSEMVYWKTLNLYRKFQFSGNFKATQYFMTIVGPHFQWLEFHVKIHGMTGKQCAFSTQMAGKRPLFLRLLAGISTLAQRTPCPTSFGIYSQIAG